MGLVVDGGSALSAQQAASDEAEQAARAGAGQLSIDALRSGVVQLNRSKAISAAEQFTVEAGHPGIATVSSGTVTVQIEYQMPTAILGMIHIPFITVSARASAVDVQGVTVGWSTRGIIPQDFRRHSATWAVLSMVALTAIVVAVPIGLYALGGLPSFHVPLGAAAREISSHRSVDPRMVSHWVGRVALFVAWITWAWMTVCVLLEIRSRLTGRSSARLPASRSLQALAAVPGRDHHGPLLHGPSGACRHAFED